MDEETTQVSQEQPVVTLDDVIAEFDVKAPEVKKPEAEPTPAPIPQHIDPYDEGQLNKWALDTANNQSALHQQVQELKTQLTQQEQTRIQDKVDADIKSAVSKIIEKVEGIDPLMAEIYLEKRAHENPGFKAIFDNRDSNPKALESALVAISNELDGKFIRTDAQLAENHRAAQQSQSTNNATAAPKYANAAEERLSNAANGNEFSRVWANIIAGG